MVKGLLLKSRMRCSPVYKPKKAWYLQSKVYLPDQVDRLEFILKEKRTFVDERYWFSVPDCAQLASDTFNIPIKVFSFDDAQGNILFLPLNNTRYTKYKPITLQLHGLCPDFFLQENMGVVEDVKVGTTLFEGTWHSTNERAKSRT